MNTPPVSILLALSPLVMSLLGCGPENTGPVEGDCATDDRICAGDQEFQRCVDGEWGEPSRCPPQGEEPLEIPTYCNDGLCTP